MTTTTSPIDGSASVLTNLSAWASEPFKTTMNLKSWFLWTGVVIVMVVAWIFILREAESLA